MKSNSAIRWLGSTALVALMGWAGGQALAAGKDTTPPVISEISAPDVKEGTPLRVSGRVTDAGGIKSVSIKVGDKSISVPINMSTTNFSFSKDIDGVKAGSYKIYIDATDNSGNKAPQITKSVEILASPKISGVAGNTNIVGQPDRAPASASNKAKGFIAVDYFSDKGINLTITGSGFGKVRGKGNVTFSDRNVSTSSIVSWADGKIVVTPKTTTSSYAYNDNVTITVTTDSGSIATSSAKLVGTIMTRPWGQCTWEVANTRLQQGKSPPQSAYQNTASINKDYVPARWDAITFGTAHVGIIASAPTSVEEKQKDGTVKVTYSFKLQDRNANWDEAMATSDQKFVVMKNNKGQVTSLVSTFRRVLDATGYYR